MTRAAKSRVKRGHLQPGGGKLKYSTVFQRRRGEVKPGPNLEKALIRIAPWRRSRDQEKEIISKDIGIPKRKTTLRNRGASLVKTQDRVTACNQRRPGRTRIASKGRVQLRLRPPRTKDIWKAYHRTKIGRGPFCRQTKPGKPQVLTLRTKVEERRRL